MAVLTDHGSQFCVNKCNGEGRAEHKFELCLRKHCIKHVLCRVKYPQINGKLERFHGSYDEYRFRFDCLVRFVGWYNNCPRGVLDLWVAKSSNVAFVRRLWPEVWLGIATKQFGW